MSADAERPLRYGAVAVIVRDQRFLVIRRSAWVRAPGAYCFPGGAIEAGESEEEALCRELREELSVQVRPLRRLWSSVTSWRVALAWWLAELDPAARPVPHPAEVASFHWLSRDEMQQLPELLESNREFLAALARGDFQV